MNRRFAPFRPWLAIAPDDLPPHPGSRPVIETSAVFSYVTARRRRRIAWPVWAALAAGGVVTVTLASIIVLDRDDRPPVAEQPTLPIVPPDERLADDSWPSRPTPFVAERPRPTRPSVAPDGAADRRGSRSETPGDQPRIALAEAQQPGEPQPAEPDRSLPPTDPGRPLADLLDPLDPGQTFDATAVPGDTKEPVSDPAPGDDNAVRRATGVR